MSTKHQNTTKQAGAGIPSINHSELPDHVAPHVTQKNRTVSGGAQQPVSAAAATVIPRQQQHLCRGSLRRPHDAKMKGTDLEVPSSAPAPVDADRAGVRTFAGAPSQFAPKSLTTDSSGNMFVHGDAKSCASKGKQIPAQSSEPVVGKRRMNHQSQRPATIRIGQVRPRKRGRGRLVLSTSDSDSSSDGKSSSDDEPLYRGSTRVVRGR